MIPPGSPAAGTAWTLDACYIRAFERNVRFRFRRAESREGPSCKGSEVQPPSHAPRAVRPGRCPLSLEDAGVSTRGVSPHLASAPWLPGCQRSRVCHTCWVPCFTLACKTRLGQACGQVRARGQRRDHPSGGAVPAATPRGAWSSPVCQRTRPGVRARLLKPLETALQVPAAEQSSRHASERSQKPRRHSHGTVLLSHRTPGGAGRAGAGSARSQQSRLLPFASDRPCPLHERAPPQIQDVWGSL